MLKINDVKIRLDEVDYSKKICSLLNVRKSMISNVKLVKKSVDARRKNDVHFNCSFEFEALDEQQILNNNRKRQLSIVKPYNYEKLTSNDEKVVIVGSGPAGLFCAYNLARSGQKVILIEQGKSVEGRQKDINEFLTSGKLNPRSNIQFGEGGAGTFSDGKLTSGIKDYRKRFVLETFVEFGANDDLLYLSKPHIGTDVLVDVVKNIREAIINYGGEVYFETKMIDIVTNNGCVEEIVVEDNQGVRNISVDHLVLAIGHSARDTYQMLYNRSLKMDPKAFAVGFRVEHSQSFVNVHQYGKFANDKHLKAADYKLAVKTDSGRGVYTFCMCPGGEVVNASSEENQVVVNGMSNYLRDSEFANSAILVTVNPNDFGSNEPLAGVAFQRHLEAKAFELGGKDYSVPVQRIEDYMNDSMEQKDEKFNCSCKRIKYANLNELFTNDLNNSIKEGLVKMDHYFKGFIEGATLLGVESRSSAPVRFYRDENMNSNITNIYPIGEGAGYAGGIMSSAIDGLKCSEAILRGNVK